MKIFAINVCPDGSTGTIMNNIAKLSREQGFDYITSTAPKKCAVRFHENYIIGSNFERHVHLAFGKYVGMEFCLSQIGTFKLIKMLKKENPDIIHLHNLHAYYLNLKMLMNYINTCNKQVIWTFHDCWPFTGHCPHFTMEKCDKWKTECQNCPQFKEYPISRVDRSKEKYNLKKKMFTGIRNLTIVTPSKWLAELVKESYFNKYPIKVINNGINLDIFKPIDCDFREKNHLENKYVILGVASPWSKRKGLDVFLKLAETVDENYQIVLVGLSKEQIQSLPPNIIGMERTQNQVELAKLYAMADVFVNPTREENFPTVNMEAIACGTPVVTFNTGGSGEMLDDTCGFVCSEDDVNVLAEKIVTVCEKKPFTADNCRKKAQNYNMYQKLQEYIPLYRSII